MSFRQILGTIVVLTASASLFADSVMEEVVVTAQKKEENIQEVPISITKMTGDRVTARFAGGEDILALAQAAPGLHVETSNGRLAPRFYMRGLETLTSPRQPLNQYRLFLMRSRWRKSGSSRFQFLTSTP